MINLVAALLVLLGLAPSLQQPDSFAREQVTGVLGAQLDSQLTRFAAYGFSGTVLVVRDGRIVLLKGYGLADVEHGIPNGAATRFEMNSMTKMFTGVGVLQLAAQGHLRVTDPVERYLGAFPAAKQGATIEQLVSHTSGLIVEGSALAERSRDAFVADVKRTPRESAPGQRYRYSNAGFSLLAALIEIVSGETYEEYLRHHAFTPAGMRTAIFRGEVTAGDSRFAHGYIGTPAALKPGPPNPYVWGTKGAGGVWATVGDMYRWLVAVESHRVLPAEQWRILTTPHRPPAEEAFGWHVELTPEGRRRIQKGGGSDDFASHLLYYPDERLAIVWATNNLRQRWRQTLNQTLPVLVLTGRSFPLPPVAAISRPSLAKYEGSYVSGQDTLELHAGPGYLYVSANHLAIPTSVMFFPQDISHFTAFDPSLRVVTRLTVDQPDGRSVTVELPDGKRISLQRAARSVANGLRWRGGNDDRLLNSMASRSRHTAITHGLTSKWSRRADCPVP